MSTDFKSIYRVGGYAFAWLLFVSSAVAQAQDKLVGEWAGTDSDGDTVSMVFNADKSAEVLFEGLPALTSSNLVGGSVEWSVDVTHDPMHIDVIIIKHAAESGRLRLIAQFLDDQTLDIRNSRDMKTRPSSFEITDSVYQILLKRQ